MATPNFSYPKMISELKKPKWLLKGTCSTTNGDEGHMQRTALQTTNSNKDDSKKKSFTVVTNFPPAF